MFLCNFIDKNTGNSLEMTTVDEQAVFAKLQAIRDIKGRTIQLDKLKNRIFREIENTDAEEKSLAEYRREMELLLQEKMSHVEELRQIHADINAMETVIKQAEENRSRSLTIANKIHEEYLPLKNEIDHMRREYLGLSPIPDLHEEEGSIITAEYSTLLKKLYDLRLKQNNSIFSRFQTTYYPSNKVGGGAHTIGASSSFSRPPLTTHHPMVPPEATVTSLPPSAPPGFLPPPNMGPMRLNKPPEMGPTRLQQSPSIGMAHPTFRSEFNVNLRQQPPPMKSCLSCHQQIHRNAPICPLCKAKSRSRNPKKPKKKDH